VSPSSPRIPPLPTDEWSEDAVAALRGAYGDAAADGLLSDAPDIQRMPNVLTTLMHHPKLVGPFLAYNATLLRAGALDSRLRELMVLRVAWRTQSAYEWAQHVRLAPRSEITTDEIDAIAAGADADAWSPLEADVLRATDQLLDHYRIDDDTWARLTAQLDERQLMEVTFVVGTYTCLAMAFNSFGIELDPELDGIAAPLPALDD
jgi:4-carboxymuconolactone decarboxylase